MAGSLGEALLLPLLAIITALIVGAIFIALTDPVVLAALGNFFNAPLAAVAAIGNSVVTAYVSLFRSSFGDPVRMVNALVSGDPNRLRLAFWPLSESLVASTPYIFAGLAVAFGFRCGLFNIGAEGQLFIGAICAVWIGYSIGLPWIFHLPLALLGAMVGAGLWGAVPGFLKAKTGAHEVITTIMMNYMAYRLADWLLHGPMMRPGYNPISPDILPSAYLPKFFADPIRFHAGFFLALFMAWVVYWLLFKSTLGFEIRTVGANPSAAKYAGMNITKNFVLAMGISGALAGMAGANEVLGLNHNLASAFSSGYGFDSIALALLGKSHPAGVVLAALLFGFLRSGATGMQSYAGIPIDIISIIQALVIIFVAAPAIVRSIYRIRIRREAGGEVFTRGWGG
ncbi:MAG: ABC transporter permease [Anaerolineae bacterium]|nr:ABC transporter permease [Anaerolineae bacterium]